MNWIQFLKDLIFILGLSLIPAAISYFLDFAFGTPGKKVEEDGPNPHAIFSGWIYWLAKRHLQGVREKNNGSRYSQFDALQAGYYEQFQNESFYIRRLAKTNFKKDVIVKAREFITWEWAAGFCIYCTNVWISFLFSGVVILFFNPELEVISVYFLPLLIAIFSHFILRKYNNS